MALCLVFSVAYLLTVLARHERMWRECGATPPDDIVLKLKDCLVDTSSSRTKQTHRHRNKSRAIRDASFALTKAVFMDAANLDAGFDFALYRYLTMAEHCLEMLEVSLTDWASVSAIAVLNVAARSALLASPIAGDGSAWYVLVDVAKGSDALVEGVHCGDERRRDDARLDHLFYSPHHSHIPPFHL